LPFGNGKRWASSGPAATIIGGWRISTLMTIMSGLPLTSAQARPASSPEQQHTPNLVAPVQILHGVGGDPWFTTGSFAQPLALTLAMWAATILAGQLLRPRRNLGQDSAFHRTLQHGNAARSVWCDQHAAILLAANGGTANGTTYKPQCTSPFGHISGATGGRQLQLGLKFTSKNLP